MFTIKHIDENGDEFAMEAASYAVKRERATQLGKPDIIRFTTYDTQYQGGDYTGLWAGIPVAGLGGQVIFVMNQHGATVAKVTFDAIPQDYWGAQDAMQAEPAALAA